MMKPPAWNGSTCGRLFCAVPLLGVISVRGRAQDSSASWVERTTDFLGARNSYCAICALFDKQRHRMVRAVDTPDGMFHLPWAVTPISVLLCSFLRQELTSALVSARSVRFILHVCANTPSRFRPRFRLRRVRVQGTRRRVLIGRYVRQIRLRWPVLRRATYPRENRKHRV
jgi:hypothetical protein